jgi:hypothetical protein
LGEKIKFFLFKINLEFKKTIKSTIQIRDKEKQKQQKLNQLMQRQPDDGRNIVI